MRPPTRPHRLVLALVAAGLIAGACGAKSDSPPTAQPALAPGPSLGPAAPAGASVKQGKADLGQVLVGPEGRTLYGFTNDVDARSTCSGACALAWPPAVVDPTWSVGPGLDAGVFATTTRDDGTLQLVAGKWPLYYFEGDATAGDTNGQGAGDVWFVVGPDAKLVKSGVATTPGYGNIPQPVAAPAQASVSLTDSALGPIVGDSGGRTLYAFTKDADGTPTCTGGCATAWPAAPAPSGTPTAGDGVDGSKLTSVARPDGGPDQLKLGKWPLYYFAGDGGPGDVNGQGSGGVWFAIHGDGTLLRST